MRTLKKLLSVGAVCLLGAVSLSGCEDDKTGAPDLTLIGDAGGDAAGSDMSGDGGNTLEFEAFVLGLIQNDTNETALPTQTEDKTFTDSMDPTKFAPLFT